MSDLPEPLVPADADLRDFAYMPLDVARLRDSDLAALVSAEAFRAAVLLWCAAWHQLPAGSLPADEQALARLAGFGRDLKGWRKIAAETKRGWTKCSDERLYHKTVSEKALEGWIEKLLQRKSSEAGNAKRYGHPFDPATFDVAIEASLRMLAALNPQSRVLKKRSGKTPTGSPKDAPTGIADETPAEAPGGNPTDPPDDLPHLSQEIRKVKEKERNARAARDVFDREFWPRYPHKVGKPTALRAWEKLWREMGSVVAPILCGLELYIRDKPADRAWLNPATFLNNRRFEDQPALSLSAPPISSSASPRVDFGGGVSWPETTVIDALKRFQSDPTSWPADRIGPPPGQPGCRVPERLLEAA